MPPTESESIDDPSQVPKEDVFKIMVATDLHLGYNEKDPIRGDDSFIAFEEILELAVSNNVDFILLGGDLFHDANPSQNALFKCITLLRRYTLGDKPIEIELLSDQTVNFGESLNHRVNYEDPDINVAIPVFSIHGNHDDPSGYGRLSSLDLLSVSGLINYFGKWVDLTQIQINPILMRKGESQLALYGLSHIHDNRLVRLFRDFKVVMEKPDEKTGKWFNLMVLHQNRADRGPKNYIPEDILPDFLNVVIWGHEHDCRILPEENYKRNFHVIQPGSPVATSLSEGESIDKHCGILQIYKHYKFKLNPIKLKTVRPFIFESIDMIDYVDEYGLDEIDASEKVWEIAKNKVEEMISKAQEKLSGDERQPQLPLIRLRISYTNEAQMFNAIRFGQQFNQRVANPMDIILFKRAIKKNKIETKPLDKETLEGVFKHEDINHETRVEEVVDRYFEEVDDSKKLQLMSSKILSEMCYRLVERNDDNAAECIIKFYKDKTQEFLLENLPGEDGIAECISRFKNKSDILYGQVLKMLDERGSTKKTTSSISSHLGAESVDLDDDSDDGFSALNKLSKKASSSKQTTSTRGSKTTANESTRGRGRGRGRGSRGGAVGTARGGGRLNVSQKPELDITTTGTHQQTVSDMLTRNMKPTRQTKKNIVYDISDSD